MIELETDVLIVGSGGAGMYAALEAAKNGASVILADQELDRSRRRHGHGDDDGCGRGRRADS